MTLFIILFMFSFVGTWIVRRYAYHMALVDYPTHRSSHDIPTPRGGGIAIVISFYIGLWWTHSLLPSPLVAALWWGVPVAIISWLDDRYTLSAKTRLIVQAISVVGALWALQLNLSLVIQFILLISMIWFINLYNFLDGIDGYAAMEAIIVAIALILFFSPLLGMILGVSVLGFLFFNWHKASIFMGDVGSATLGFWIAVIVVYSLPQGHFVMWLIILSLFWVDATVTLLRRLWNREAIFQAHKKHAYQRLVQSGWRHDQVVIAAFVINSIFLILLYYFNEMENYILSINLLSMIMILKWIEEKKGFI